MSLCYPSTLPCVSPLAHSPCLHRAALSPLILPPISQGKNTASALAALKAAATAEVLSAGPLFPRFDSLDQVQDLLLSSLLTTHQNCLAYQHPLSVALHFMLLAPIYSLCHCLYPSLLLCPALGPVSDRSAGD